MSNSIDVDADVRIVLDSSEDAEAGLVALAAAESLTDELHLFEVAGAGSGAHLLDALHQCNFVVERNDEWRFTGTARTHLRLRLIQEQLLSLKLHQELLALAKSPILRLLTSSLCASSRRLGSRAKSFPSV